MIKNTLELQKRSVVAFANVLGFYLQQSELGCLNFVNEDNVQVKFQKMTDWHNGVLPLAKRFASLHDYARAISNHLHIKLDADTLKVAYDSRLVQEVKYKYAKRQRKFVKDHDTADMVKLMDGVTL